MRTRKPASSFLVALGARLFLSAWHVEFRPASFRRSFARMRGMTLARVRPVVAFVSKGWSHIGLHELHLHSAFLYTLYPFYHFGGSLRRLHPIILSDAATAPVVYLIAKRLASGRIPLAQA